MYRERPSKVWTLICVTLYVVGVAWMAVDALPADLGPWLAVSALFLLLLFAFTSVPISKYVYNRIDLDHTTLRVGRERFALTDLDPASAAAALDLTRQPPGRPFAAHPAMTPGQRPPRLVGGGWAVPMGMDSVIVTTRQGEALTIPSRAPQAFLTALVGALAPHQRA
ncbi:hypothetical protein [Streptomyces sp. NPDC057702]|uniref:hypothetical protein n=1 Tax=unclassified Streptomyces TaxID=2593676 RepID=UPI003695D957